MLISGSWIMGGLNFLSLRLLWSREVKMDNSAQVSKLCLHSLHLRGKLATTGLGGGGRRLVSSGWSRHSGGRGIRLAQRRIGL